MFGLRPTGSNVHSGGDQSREGVHLAAWQSLPRVPWSAQIQTMSNLDNSGNTFIGSLGDRCLLQVRSKPRQPATLLSRLGGSWQVKVDHFA